MYKNCRLKENGYVDTCILENHGGEFTCAQRVRELADCSVEEVTLLHANSYFEVKIVIGKDGVFRPSQFHLPFPSFYLDSLWTTFRAW